MISPIPSPPAKLPSANRNAPCGLVANKKWSKFPVGLTDRFTLTLISPEAQATKLEPKLDGLLTKLTEPDVVSKIKLLNVLVSAIEILSINI